MILILTSLILYLVSFILFALKKDKIAPLLFISGSVINIVLIMYEWIIANTPPFSNMHQVMVLLGSSSIVGYISLVVRKKMRFLAPIFPLGAFIPLLLAVIVFKGDSTWKLAPALRSPWFVPHVISYMISYSFALVAFIFLVISFVGKKLKKLELQKKFENAAYQTISLALPLMTFGMLSGALWANEVWGGYWSWDPKESWALITWTLYIIYLHLRHAKIFSNYANLAHLLAFLSLLTTFILVNLLPKLSSQLHSYV